MSEQLNIQDVISLMRESNKQFESTVYIPSLNKEIHVKPMNALHFKSIIKSSISGLFADNQFNINVFNIFKDILDPSIPLSTMNVLDKECILLALRLYNVSENINVEFSSDKGSKTESVSLKKIVSGFKKLKLDFTDAIISENGYTININYPSISEEYSFDNLFDNSIVKKIDPNDKNAVKEVPGTMFLYYIAPFIRQLTIGENIINLISRTPTERLAIIEKLPGNLLTKIIETVDSVFAKQLVNIKTLEKEIDGEKYTGTIKISTDLFI